MKLDFPSMIVNTFNVRPYQLHHAICVVLVVLGTGLFTDSSQALPLGWTSFTESGFLGVQDTAGNQWLSPTATEGLSFNAAATSSFVTNDGFQTVSQSQFLGLLIAYGLPASTPIAAGNPNFPEVVEFLSSEGMVAGQFVTDFGFTDSGFFGQFPFERTFGLLAPNSDPTLALISMVGVLNNNGDPHGGVESGARSLDANTGFNDIGTWLFKSSASVPEPPTALILCAGLFSLVGCNYRRRKQAITK